MPHIDAISCVLPSHEIPNEYFYEWHSKSYIDSTTNIVGVDKRYWAASETTLSLCVRAAENLFAGMAREQPPKFSKDKIDLLIFVTQTPGSMMPAIAYQAHSELQLADTCACITINAGCTGFVEGVGMAFDLIKSRGYKTALLLVGDVLSKNIDVADSSTAPIFGDAGTATVIINDEAKPYRYVFESGTKAGSAQAIELGLPGTEDPPFLHMKGMDVFNFTISGIPKFINSVEKKWRETFGIDPEVDLYVFHQANKMIIVHIIKKMKLDAEKVPVNIEEFGNTSGATIPLLLCSLHGKGISFASQRVLLCGFGVGLSWAAMLCDAVDLSYAAIEKSK